MPRCHQILTVKFEINIEPWLSNTGNESTEPIAIAKRPNGHDDADQDVVSRELRHNDESIPLERELQ